MMWLVVAFLAGGVAEYLSDRWTIRWNAATSARSYPLGRDNMRRHVRKTVALGWGLLLVSAVDVAAIFGGWDLFAAVIVGSLAGSALATHGEMWRKWDRKTANLRDEEEE